MKAKRNAKYQRIYDYFRKAILEGAVKPGDQLPTETELCAEFAASRPTVSRALALLAKEGLVRRRAGSGTFVSDRAENGSPVTRRLGLLIPGLGATEIFEPMCAHIAAVAHAHLVGAGGEAHDDVGRGQVGVGAVHEDPPASAVGVHLHATDSPGGR